MTQIIIEFIDLCIIVRINHLEESLKPQCGELKQDGGRLLVRDHTYMM